MRGTGKGSICLVVPHYGLRVSVSTQAGDPKLRVCVVSARLVHVVRLYKCDRCLEAESAHSQSTGPSRQLTLRLAKIEKALIGHLVRGYNITEPCLGDRLG